VVAVGRCHIPAPALGLQIALAHQAAYLLVVDDDAALTKRGADAPVAVGLELVADRLHPGDELRLTDRHGRCVIEGRSGQSHQSTSLRDGEPTGPAMTDIVPLLPPWCAFSGVRPSGRRTPQRRRDPRTYQGAARHNSADNVSSASASKPSTSLMLKTKSYEPQNQGKQLFSPGILWSGLSLNRSGWEVHALQINAYGVRPLRVLSLLAKLFASTKSRRWARS
jgi:hypothetical protein